MKKKIYEAYIPFIDLQSHKEGEHEGFVVVVVFNLALELCIKKRGTYILSLSERLAYLFSRVRKTNIYWI